MPAQARKKAKSEKKELLDEIDDVAHITEDALSYAMAHGIIMVEKGDKHALSHAPFALLPFPVDKAAFIRMQELAKPFARLVDRISRDPAFLISTLEGAATSDTFTARLLGILKKVQHEKQQSVRLGCFRSDYMVHSEEKDGVVHVTPLQVENNTIAASFAGLSTAIASMHRFLFTRHVLGEGELPPNDAIANLAKGMALAHAKVVSNGGAREGSVVVMVVQPGETNSVDQRMLEYALWSNHQVPMVRASLSDINTHSPSVCGPLTYKGKGVSVVYFRAGYTPRDYPSDDEWSAVLTIERSSAVKCPCVAYHLAGTKKVQQQLSLPGVVERFCSADDAKLLRTSFAGLWGLERDDEETQRVITDAITNHDDYVLKPQREGGGNNFYHEEMADKLRVMSVEERSAYILMQKIKPVAVKVCLVKRGERHIGPCISEFGHFSSFIGDGGEEVHNELCGHLVRTKAVGVDEGGVASGFSCLSSPLLV